jgi:hypothetical protein
MENTQDTDKYYRHKLCLSTLLQEPLDEISTELDRLINLGANIPLLGTMNVCLKGNVLACIYFMITRTRRLLLQTLPFPMNSSLISTQVKSLTYLITAPDTNNIGYMKVLLAKSSNGKIKVIDHDKNRGLSYYTSDENLLATDPLAMPLKDYTVMFYITDSEINQHVHYRNRRNK